MPRFTIEEYTSDSGFGNDPSSKVSNHDFTILLDGKAFAFEPEQVGEMEDVTFRELRRVVEILNRFSIPPKEKLMTDNVIPLGNITRLDIPVDRVLDAAKEDISDRVVVLGWDKDGELYFASSFADGGEVLWLMEKAKLALLNA